ncbi:hypothetical protein Tco_1111855 [Tanacetum coccineum]|uniref:Uncharacterized protein n=1 Tax=Tanacetum coccineum TaxID=301880 RepID=A0ABQ5IQ23_9ASTR
MDGMWSRHGVRILEIRGYGGGGDMVVLEMDGMWSRYGVRILEIRGYGGGGDMVVSVLDCKHCTHISIVLIISILMARMEFCDKHNMVAFLKKPSGSEEFHQIVDFLADSHISIKIVNEGEQQLTVTVDGQTFAITKASIRRHLQLVDADGISSLPNTEIFDQFSLMGYVSTNDKLTFQKGVHVPLFDSMLVHDQHGQGEGPTLTVESQHTPSASPSTSQPTTSQPTTSQPTTTQPTTS